MRVLAHIHTFNEAAVIDRAVDALLRQTRQPDAIIIVDNGSTDGTLDRTFPERVTVIRNPANLGTSGSVRTGFAYALEHGFDWILIFDADSVAQPDALEKLLDLYAAWPGNLQDKTGFIACLHYNVLFAGPQHGGLFTRHGLAPSKPVPELRYFCCHHTIWSGCLYRLAAVRQIGLPQKDYFQDWGDVEYGYRVMKAGYKGFIHQDAVVRHNLRGSSSFVPVEVKLGPAKFTLYEAPPERCYYICRNVLYFALYDFAEDRLGFVRSVSWWFSGFPLRLLLKPWSHRKQLLACCRGIWHGLTGNIAARY